MIVYFQSKIVSIVCALWWLMHKPFLSYTFRDIVYLKPWSYTIFCTKNGSPSYFTCDPVNDVSLYVSKLCVFPNESDISKCKWCFQTTMFPIYVSNIYVFPIRYWNEYPIQWILPQSYWNIHISSIYIYIILDSTEWLT